MKYTMESKTENWQGICIHRRKREESFWHKCKKPDEHFVFNRNKRGVVHNSACSLGVKLLPFSRVCPMVHKSKSWKQNEMIHLSDGHLSCWEQCKVTSYIPGEGILRKQTYKQTITSWRYFLVTVKVSTSCKMWCLLKPLIKLLHSHISESHDVEW